MVASRHARGAFAHPRDHHHAHADPGGGGNAYARAIRGIVNFHARHAIEHEACLVLAIWRGHQQARAPAFLHHVTTQRMQRIGRHRPLQSESEVEGERCRAVCGGAERDELVDGERLVGRDRHRLTPCSPPLVFQLARDRPRRDSHLRRAQRRIINAHGGTTGHDAEGKHPYLRQTLVLRPERERLPPGERVRGISARGTRELQRVRVIRRRHVEGAQRQRVPRMVGSPQRRDGDR
ncbi:MAG: hypothetical protein ABIP66_02115 [Gemmatimonadaceae bacterium]